MGRVLCVTSSFPRWRGDYAGSFVLALAHDLLAYGWNVDVLTPHAPGSLNFEILEGVQVYRFRYWWPESGETLCSQGSALVNLRKSSIEKSKTIPLVALQFSNLLLKQLKNKYDLIHSHWILPQGLNGMLLSKCLNVPHVVTVHGSDITALQGIVLNYLKRTTLLQSSAVTVNSSFTGKTVLDLVPDIKELHQIPMGVSTDFDVDEKKIKELRDTYCSKNGLMLLFVGRLVEEKGLGDFLKAVSMLVDKIPEIAAVVVGDGQDRGKYELLAEELSLSERVKFVGSVNSDEVSAYFAMADIFVGPSKTAKNGCVEAQGLTFIEAMLAKTPVVATAVGGIVDSVIHEETGLLIRENSPNEIAAAVMRLVLDQELSESLTEKGYELARNKFSRTKSAGDFSRLFKKLVK